MKYEHPLDTLIGLRIVKLHHLQVQYQLTCRDYQSSKQSPQAHRRCQKYRKNQPNFVTNPLQLIFITFKPLLSNLANHLKGRSCKAFLCSPYFEATVSFSFLR